jgi:hypothetical protein
MEFPPCEVLATPCTTSLGLNYFMEEIMFNPFAPNPVPPMCEEIAGAGGDAAGILAFFRADVRRPELNHLLDLLEKEVRESSGRPLMADSVTRYVASMHGLRGRKRGSPLSFGVAMQSCLGGADKAINHPSQCQQPRSLTRVDEQPVVVDEAKPR